MKTMVFFLVLLVSGHSKNLQDWQVISYMNDITVITSKENNLWVGTTGGAYSYSFLDSSYVLYTNVDGLGSLNLTSLAIDKYGTIFFGGIDGILSVYHEDTKKWHSYSELEQQTINDLFIKEDTLWAATEDGVAVYIINDRLPQFRDLYENFPVSPNTIQRVSIYNHFVFLATDKGLLYAPSNFTRYNLKDANLWTNLDVTNGLPSNIIHDILENSNTLVVGTDAGLCTLDTIFTIKVSEEWSFGAVTRLISSDKNLFAASAQKLFSYQSQTWQEIGIYSKPISCGTVNASEDLWLGLKDGGLQKRTWLNPLIIDGPSNNFIGRLTKDKNNNLWIMSGITFSPTGRGFYQYSPSHWNNYSFSGLTQKNYTSTVFSDQNGDIWIGCWGGGVTLLKSDEVICYHAFPGKSELRIKSYLEQRSLPIEEVPEEKRTCFPPLDSKNAPLDLNISQFITDSQGNLWCADYMATGGRCIVIIPKLSDGGYALTCEEWLYYGPHLNLSSSQCEITCMEFDFFGRLWFGTRNEGVFIIDYNGTLYDLFDDKLYIPEGHDNLLSTRILSLKMDHDGIMWIGTAGGLNSYDGRQLYRHLGESGELGPIDNKINQIFVDFYNNKWFATDGGVSILDASKSPWDASAWNHYFPGNSGLPSKYIKSIFVDNHEGQAYIGTDNGLAIFKGIYSQIRENYRDITAGPNPFILEDNSEFIIKNLMMKSTVKIFTVNAILIRTLSPTSGNVQGSRAIWDGRDSHNNLVSSGIYLYLAYGEDGTAAQGKIAVIRP